jgi:predicted SnoaL-like aldol condensation-catalyzing enzyme
VGGLADLMANNHSLICNGHVDTKDKTSSIEAWSTFFKMNPDYMNHFTRIESRGDFVVIVGSSTSSNEQKLNSSALWSARIQNDKVTEWQVYEDKPENRKKLQLQVNCN